MPNPFYGVALVSPASVGIAMHRAWFSETTIAATIQLTSFWVQAPAQFTPHQKHMAQAYLITKNTPLSSGLVPNPDKLRDSSAWLTTDNVTFRLDTANSVVNASALGLIHDRSSLAANRHEVLRTVDLAVYDEEGTVLATHREVQLHGGREIDEDAAEEFVLKAASSPYGASLKVARLDLDQLPADMPTRIEPRTQSVAMPK